MKALMISCVVKILTASHTAEDLQSAVESFVATRAEFEGING